MKRKSQLRFPVVENTKGEKVRVVKRDIGLKHDIGLKYTIKIRIRGTKRAANKPYTSVHHYSCTPCAGWLGQVV